MKTFELVLDIILIVAFCVQELIWVFTQNEWNPFQRGLFRDPIGAVKWIALGLALLSEGILMIWLSSR
jgi:hypothetical protein